MRMRVEKQETADFWSSPAAAVLEGLGTHAEGLSGPEAEARLVRLGPNRIADQPRRRLLLNFLARFRNPLILMLLAAAAVSAATNDPTSFVIITTIVLLSVILDFVQEHRAEIAADKLRERRPEKPIGPGRFGGAADRSGRLAQARRGAVRL